MDENELARRFKALGDPTRLRIFALLRDCCQPVALENDGAVRPAEGPTVGEVCCRLTGAGKITSTLSAHIKELRDAGLIVCEKRGKYVVCAVDPRALTALAAFFGPSEAASQEKTNGCC